MPFISRIQLPDDFLYEIKDEEVRKTIEILNDEKKFEQDQSAQ